jgi:hypothetical protein
MAKNKTIEAEGSELILQNSNGDTIIIPKKDRQKILEKLNNNDHAGIDEFASSLPYMEDYAENGTLLPDVGTSGDVTTTPTEPETKETTVAPKAIFNKGELEGLRNRYSSGEMATMKEFGCLGSSCRNFGKIHPGLPNYYEELSKAGAYSEGVHTDISRLKGEAYKKALKGNSPGIDSWELPYYLEEKGLGKNLFRHDPKNYDPSEVTNYDYKSFPVGTILSFGDAKGVYANPEGKSYRGKEEPLYRHSGTVVGYTEGKDLEGNPTTDILVDDMGQLKRIGDSKEAEQTWSDYSTKSRDFKLYGATTRKSTADWTYEKVKSLQDPEKLIAEKKAEKAEKYNEYVDELENDVVSGKIPKGSTAYSIAMAHLQSRDKYRESLTNE